MYVGGRNIYTCICTTSIRVRKPARIYINDVFFGTILLCVLCCRTHNVLRHFKGFGRGWFGFGDRFVRIEVDWGNVKEFEYAVSFMDHVKWPINLKKKTCLNCVTNGCNLMAGNKPIKSIRKTPTCNCNYIKTTANHSVLPLIINQFTIISWIPLYAFTKYYAHAF